MICLYTLIEIDQPVPQVEVTTRRPTRPRNFDPRRQRVSTNGSLTKVSVTTPTLNKPQRITVRQRGRARRPVPQNIRPKIVEDKPESTFSSFSAIEPTSAPKPAAVKTTTQPQRPRGFFTEIQPTTKSVVQKTSQTRRQPPRSFILPKDSQGNYQSIIF